jgi:radical SAM superfamily enzyme YgiQ (UPF0313 family)
VHPQHWIHRYGSGVYPRSLRYAPLTMPTLRALVPRHLPVHVTIVDEMIGAVPLGARPDLVGITCMTGTAARAYELADHFRRSGSTVILGGVHATLMTAEALPHADCVVRGYAEEAWPRALEDYFAGSLARVYEGAGLAGENSIVRPDRSSIRRSSYGGYNTLELGRGCVNRCSFCVSPTFSPRYVRRNIGNVLDEIRAMKGKLIYFLDPDLVCDKPYALEFFRSLRRLRKWWVGCASLDLFDDLPLLDAMTESGCRGLLLGFESLNEECLRSVAKSRNLGRDYRTHVEELHRRGILVNATFVFGFDSDGPEVFEETADFVIESRVDLPQFTLLTPFPGTPLFSALDAEGRILTHDWSRYNGQHAVFLPKRMTPETLEQGIRDARRRAHAWGSTVRRLAARPWWVKPPMLWANLQYARYLAAATANAERPGMVMETPCEN